MGAKCENFESKRRRMSVRYIYQTQFGMSDPPCKSVLIDGITVYDGVEESLFTV